MVSRPIDVLCEEERLRRLSERMAFDDGDGAEPARQRRARILVEEMTTMGPRLRSPSSEKRRSKAVKALEAGLQARWKAVVHEMAETPKHEKKAEPKVEMDALDGVTVRSVVGLRGLSQVPPEVEAVVLAVLQLVSSDYQPDGDQPPQTWEEARRVLLKPGHFVSSLRKFHLALDRGQVSGASLAYATRQLELAGELGDSTGVHEGAQQLHAWLRAALGLAATARLSAVASPARAGMEASLGAVVNAANAEASPKAKRAVAWGGASEMKAEGMEEPPGVKELGRSPESDAKYEEKGEAKPKAPKSSPLRSTSPKSYRPSGYSGPSSGQVKSAATATTPSTQGSARSAGFNVSWSSLSGGTAGPSAGAKPASRSLRMSVAGTSPKRRASPSPTPAASKPTPKVVSAKSQPRRQAANGGAASPLPKRPSEVQVKARSPAPSLTRSRSAGRELKANPGPSNLSFATISAAAGIQAVGIPTSDDFAGARIRLDREKKEVRQIKALESQIKWDMQREETRQTELERREEARQIMEWRDQEVREMREYVEGKSREQRALELLESKEYQQFKRDWKQAKRKEEIERIKVQLAEDQDNAKWRIELQRALEADRRLLLQEAAEAQEELKELKEKERQKEKFMQEEERAHDIALEYAHQAQQISSEKEALLRSLALLKERSKTSVAGTASRVGTTLWSAAR
ncbi:unnamed protein product [Effrenium voratum]|uniref:Uncharacterized protein n=1 Tax=Effrenium voratum TaxID=2562239 RepID=A0AA36MLM9_9DINO|nr:unnamed protein product [Effrenium voratum]CAJ1422176.1 unnamed protein product [Effrenium voratum]